MTAPILDPDKALLTAAWRGGPEAVEALLRSLADLVWTACRRVTRDDADAQAAFREVMAAIAANGFARLKDYDGRARVRVYVALVVRDLLLERAIKLLVLDAARGWGAFEAFFGEDIRRMIERSLPGSAQRQNREDAYQAVCEALLDNDLRRLRAYSGRGSPSGFVLQIVENLVVDFVRTIIPRRRLPAAIARLSALDQSVFRLLYWERLAPDPAILCVHLARSGEAPPPASTIVEAIERVRQALPPGYWAEPRGDGQMVEGEGADLLEQALEALQQVLPRLPATEQLYLRLALAGEPAREIARMLSLPVEEVHKLAQRLKRRLRDELSDAEVVKRWRLSV